MKQNDKRLHCSDEKRNILKEAIVATRNRRVNQIVKCFELKLNLSRLNKKQLEELEMLFVEGKWFYNHVLAYKKENEVPFSTINTTNITEVTHFGKDKEEIVSELKFLKSQQKQQIVSRMNANEKTIATLVRKGLQKRGGLKFKSELNSIPLPQYKVSYKFKGESSVRIQGIHGKIHLYGIHQLHGVDEFANANLIHKPNGYYLKVTCYFNKENVKPVPCNGKELGIDFGISNNLTTSEGEVVNISVGESEHLKALQRKLARQKKGSNNRKKTIHNIQIAYQKMKNKKQECANQFIHKMKQYETVVIQNEQLSKWHEDKRRGYSHVVQHSCMGLIKAKLKNLPNVVVLDEHIPTTKWCPTCGKENNLTLNERTYSCECGYSQNRDIHAAQNMLKIAHLVLGNDLVPTEHREVKHVEFLSKSKTMKHEDVTFQGCH
jgi:putative transposase